MTFQFSVRISNHWQFTWSGVLGRQICRVFSKFWKVLPSAKIIPASKKSKESPTCSAVICYGKNNLKISHISFLFKIWLRFTFSSLQPSVDNSFKLMAAMFFLFKNLEIWPWEKPKLLKIMKNLRPKHTLSVTMDTHWLMENSLFSYFFTSLHFNFSKNNKLFMRKKERGWGNSST